MLIYWENVFIENKWSSFNVLKLWYDFMIDLNLLDILWGVGVFFKFSVSVMCLLKFIVRILGIIICIILFFCWLIVIVIIIER